MSLYLGNNLVSGVATPTEPTRNLGQIIESLVPLTDAGLHLLDGALINGSGIYSAFVTYIAGLVSTYPNLFVTESDWQTSVTTYGVCGKFVYDSVNNTVRLPKITGKIDGTTDINALGDLVEQYVKLPNITGSFGGVITGGSFTGSFTQGAYLHSWAYNNGNAFYNTNFDASRSSSVYSGNGTDTEIHEQAINVLYYIVIATTTKTEIEVDIDEIATDLNGKADVDLVNCTDVANIKMAHNAMPSNTYADLTVGASRTTYTAPADGYFIWQGYLKGAVCFFVIINENTGIGTQSYSAYNDQSGIHSVCLCPVKKGDVIKIDYYASSTLTTTKFRFIYAVGSESEAQ